MPAGLPYTVGKPLRSGRRKPWSVHIKWVVHSKGSVTTIGLCDDYITVNIASCHDRLAFMPTVLARSTPAFDQIKMLAQGLTGPRSLGSATQLTPQGLPLVHRLRVQMFRSFIAREGAVRKQVIGSCSDHLWRCSLAVVSDALNNKAD